MPSFRERPLTWLFLIATLCLDAVALSTDNESTFANALAIGQLFVVSGWLVLGRGHRLARAAAFIGAIGVLTAPDYVIPRLHTSFYVDLVWPAILALLIAMGVATVVNTAIWLSLARLTSRGLKEFRRADWQFPLAELFGWTIIVAVASVGLRLADFSYMDNPKDIATGFGLTYLAGAMMAFILGDYRDGARSPAIGGKVIAAMVLSLVAIVLAKSLPSDAQLVAVGSLAYTACWCVALKLDWRKAARDAAAIEASTPLKLFAEER